MKPELSKLRVFSKSGLTLKLDSSGYPSKGIQVTSTITERQRGKEKERDRNENKRRGTEFLGGPLQRLNEAN